jgi:dihydroflavonol-4-reductase
VSHTIGLLTGRKTPSLVIPVWPCIVPAYCSLYISKLRGANPKFTPFALKTIRTHTRVSHEKSSRELGYNPRPFEETIRDILSWFRDRGLLE